MTKFKIDDRIIDIKSGGVYVVTATPQSCRLEHSGEPAYSYVGNDGTMWVRSQTEMEDGRFVYYKYKESVEDKNSVMVSIEGSRCFPLPYRCRTNIL
jgi:hypothetical protein